jgi:hypothetical protein
VRGIQSLDPYDYPPDAQVRAHKDQVRPPQGVLCAPSIAFWDFAHERSLQSVHWSDYFTKGMKVDCKIVHPTGLFECLLDDGDGWSDLGVLVGPASYSETREEKARRLAQAAGRTQLLSLAARKGVHRIN